MGHERVRILPKTRRWIDVVEQIGSFPAPWSKRAGSKKQRNALGHAVAIAMIFDFERVGGGSIFQNAAAFLCVTAL